MTVNVYPEPLNSIDESPPPSSGGFIGGGLSLGIGIGLSHIRSFGGAISPSEQLTFNGEPLTFGGENLNA